MSRLEILFEVALRNLSRVLREHLHNEVVKEIFENYLMINLDVLNLIISFCYILFSRVLPVSS